MGNNIINTEFLEFYGLPGCGKSTISHELAMRLRDRGFDVYEPSYVMDHERSCRSRKFEKAFSATILMLTHPVIFSRLVRILYPRLSSLNEFALMIVNISYKLVVYLRQTKHDYIVFDEGIIQSVISILIRENEDGTEFWKYFLSDFWGNKQIRSIYINTSVENSMDRIQKRKENDSRVEKLSSLEEMKKMLLVYQTACDNISLKDTMSLDGNQTKSDIVNIILLGMFGETE